MRRQRLARRLPPARKSLQFCLALCSVLPHASTFHLASHTSRCLGSFKERGFRSMSSHLWTSRASEGHPTDEEMTKWERMYQEGAQRRSSSSPLSFRTAPSSEHDVPLYDDSNANSPSTDNNHHEVRVVSFDLDNTLWRTGATIAAANDALAAFLDANHVTQPKRVERVMGDLFQENKAHYSPKDTKAKAPVLLTLLRKDAIQSVLAQHNNYTEQEAAAMAERAFDVWMQARHEAIPSHFASSVTLCLQEITSSIRSSSGQKVLVGAITDGNSDPRLITELAPYFDFCINAEQVGTSKPDPRVYLQAVEHVLEEHGIRVEDVMTPLSSSGEKNEQPVGPWWVHIGDDFVKDVVAAKSLGMRSVWCRELVLDKLQQVSTKEVKSTRKLEDLVKEVSEMKVIKMQIGSDDYLADSFQKEFADAVVDDFGHVARLLQDWHKQGLYVPQRSQQPVEEPTTSEPSESPVRPEEQAAKFCLFCGEKLPSIAKFCSTCGNEQTGM